MELQGYCIIKKDANFKNVMGAPVDWLDKPLRAVELNDNTDSAIVLSESGTMVGMFDYKDIRCQFKCNDHGEVLLPPNLDAVEKLLYFTYTMGRNVGYNKIVRTMVIMGSLHSGEFNDKFLWQRKQNSEIVNAITHLRKKGNGNKKTV
jgi:hypothetical protein